MCRCPQALGLGAFLSKGEMMICEKQTLCWLVENKIKEYEEALKRISLVLHSSDLPAHRAEAERVDRILDLYKEK